jgi:hypothetical protein
MIFLAGNCENEEEIHPDTFFQFALQEKTVTWLLSEKLVQHLAAQVEGTEAAAYLLSEKDGVVVSHPVAHVRPGELSPSVLSAAEQVFRQILTRFLSAGSDAAVEIKDKEAEQKQYCLVKLLQVAKVTSAAILVIVWAKDQQDAESKLAALDSAVRAIGKGKT